MIWQIMISIAVWLVLMVLSANLIGFIVRGSFARSEEREMLAVTGEPDVIGQRWNVFGIILAGVLLGALLFFGNLSLGASALMLMAARLPDLLWEIDQGRKLRMSDMRKTAFPVLSTLLMWASLPVVWYALYKI